MTETSTNQAHLSNSTEYATAEELQTSSPPQPSPQQPLSDKKKGFLNSRFSENTVKRLGLFGFFFQHIFLEIALPLILFFTLKNSIGDLWATIYSSIPGFISTLFTILIKRRFEPIPIIIIISFFIGFALTLKYNNPKLKQIDGSIITGIIGLAFLFSLILKKPLIYYTSRPWITKNDPEQLAEFDEKWKIPKFRRVMINLSLIWGFGLILQCVINLILIFTINLDLLMILSPIITYGGLALLAIISVSYGVRKRKEAERFRELEKNQIDNSSEVNINSNTIDNSYNYNNV